jgi:hypothetical protein
MEQKGEELAMEVLRIDHIHFKTSDTDKVVPIFTKLLGTAPTLNADFAEEHGVRDTIWGLPNAVQVTQVINPEIAEGKIYKDVPNGIFGFALHVADIEVAAAEIEGMGGKLLYENNFSNVVLEKVFEMESLGLIIEINQYDDAVMSGDTKGAVLDDVMKHGKDHN